MTTLRRGIAALLISLIATGYAQSAIIQTLNIANVTVAGGNNGNQSVEISGGDVRAFDINGSGANLTTTELIVDSGPMISNYQLSFVHELSNTLGGGNMFFLEIGGITNNFARMSINRNLGMDYFGRSDGSNTGISNPQLLTGGVEYWLSVYMNNTAGALTYLDPYNTNQNLVNGTYDVWFGPAGAMGLIEDGRTQEHVTVSTLNSVRYRMRSVNAIEFETTFSSISIAPVPEASTIALTSILLFGTIAFGYRKRQLPRD